jgi:hypothetical protein
MSDDVEALFFQDGSLTLCLSEATNTAPRPSGLPAPEAPDRAGYVPREPILDGTY